MRIAFDGTTLTPGRTGVGYYTEHLLQHLAREVEGDRATSSSSSRISRSTPRSRCRGMCASTTGGASRCASAGCRCWPARVLEDIRADVAHFTNGMLPLGTGAARVVTIHDMSLTLFPRCHPLRRLVINRPLLERRGARRRRGRDGVAQRAARSAAAPRHSCRSRHGGPRSGGPGIRADRRSGRAWRASARATACPSDSCSTSGAIEPRKNLPRLMDAFADARAQGVAHELVCVGPYGWSSRDLYEHIDRLGLRRVVHFTGYVPVDDLPVIYNLAEFFVFPSIYEGFGLPVVEAMACGTPVITANTSSLEEIATGAAEMVDPQQHRGADARPSCDWRSTPDRRAELSALGLVRAARVLVGANRARDARRSIQRAAGVQRRAGAAADTGVVDSAVAREVGVARGAVMTAPSARARGPRATLAFDRLAPDYDALAAGEIFQLLRRRTHTTFARCFTPESRVLEIGCGTGIDTAFLAATRPRVVACDPSEEMVSRSLRRLAHAGLDDARDACCRAGSTDLASFLDALASPARLRRHRLELRRAELRRASRAARRAGAHATCADGGSVLLGLMGRVVRGRSAVLHRHETAQPGVAPPARWRRARCRSPASTCRRSTTASRDVARRARPRARAAGDRRHRRRHSAAVSRAALAAAAQARSAASSTSARRAAGAVAAVQPRRRSRAAACS